LRCFVLLKKLITKNMLNKIISKFLVVTFLIVAMFAIGQNRGNVLNVSADTIAISQCDSTRPYLDEQKRNNCVWSNGGWNSSMCTCTCPINYQPQETGSCLYVRPATTCLYFTYSSWSSCQSDGTKTRTVLSSYPTGCTGGNPSLNESCTYVPPTTTIPACTSFTYSDWSDCKTDGTKTRTVLSSYPTGCTGGTPSLNESCTYVPPTTTIPACTSFTYSDWSDCKTDGTKTRTVLSSYPTGCTGGTFSLSESCSSTNIPSVCTYFTYSSWSSCQSDGTKTRTVLSSYPTGCTGGNPSLNESCTYVPPAIPECTSISYSDWSSCQADGTQTRTIKSSYPTGCRSDNSVLSQSCVYSYCSSRSILNDQKQYNCTSSNGVWNSSMCTCTCPVNYQPQETGSCLYVRPVTTCTLFKYSDWSSCQSDGTKTRTVLSSYPTGCTGGTPSLSESCKYVPPTTTPICTSFTYSDWGQCINGQQSRSILSRYPANCINGQYENVTRSCGLVQTCQRDEWVCGDWTSCINGKQSRKCQKTFDCFVSDDTPQTERICLTTTIATGIDKKESTTSTKKSDVDTSTTSKEKNSTTTSTTSTATVSTQTSETSVKKVEEKKEDKSANLNSDKIDSSNDGVVVSIPNNVESVRKLENKTVEEAKKQLPEECIKSGWNDVKKCELYLQQTRIVSECFSKNINTRDECKKYLLDTYGKPLRCEGLKDTECDRLINDVILSDLKEAITPEVKQILSESVGQNVIINVENKTITVDIAKENKPAEMVNVKIENLPLATTTKEVVSAKLVPMVQTSASQQQTASAPAAIVFDDDGDGLPNDLEKRLGTDPRKKDTDDDGINDKEEVDNGTNPLSSDKKQVNIILEGIDKALAENKSLEQPKFSEITASTSLSIMTVDTVAATAEAPSNLRLQGKAQPNTIVTLYIYSAMPIVITVRTDENGNWVYDLDKTLVDGKHEVYVAINDDEGKIVAQSVPTLFFVEEAQAVSMDEYMNLEDSTSVRDRSRDMMISYMFGGLGLILILIVGILIARGKKA
jgi:hypothetical protein